jgi:hypothetical protein
LIELRHGFSRSGSRCSGGSCRHHERDASSHLHFNGRCSASMDQPRTLGLHADLSGAGIVRWRDLQRSRACPLHARQGGWRRRRRSFPSPSDIQRRTRKILDQHCQWVERCNTCLVGSAVRRHRQLGSYGRYDPLQQHPSGNQPASSLVAQSAKRRRTPDV